MVKEGPDGSLTYVAWPNSNQPEIAANTVLDAYPMSSLVLKNAKTYYLSYKDGKWLRNRDGETEPSIPFNGMVEGGNDEISASVTIVETTGNTSPMLVF